MLIHSLNRSINETGKWVEQFLPLEWSGNRKNEVEAVQVVIRQKGQEGV